METTDFALDVVDCEVVSIEIDDLSFSLPLRLLRPFALACLALGPFDAPLGSSTASSTSSCFGRLFLPLLLDEDPDEREVFSLG